MKKNIPVLTLLALYASSALGAGPEQDTVRAAAVAAAEQSGLMAKARALVGTAQVSQAPVATAATSMFGLGALFGASGDSDNATASPLAQLFGTDVDPTCEALVAPFGLGDNIKSLGMLGAELAVNKLPFFGGGGAAGKPDAIRLLRRAGWTMNWLPMEVETALGKYMHTMMAGNLLDPGRKSDKPLVDRAEQMLRKLLAPVSAALPYQFQVAVRRQGDGVQALPGGIMHIDRNLLASPRNEERAYVELAHELAHVLQRHTTRATQARLTDAVDSFDGLKRTMNASNPSPSALADYASLITTRSIAYSRPQEMQADACTVRLLQGVYPDPARLRQVLARQYASLGPQLPDSSAFNEMQVTMGQAQGGRPQEQHPNLRERRDGIEMILQQVRADGADGARPGARQL